MVENQQQTGAPQEIQDAKTVIQVMPQAPEPPVPSLLSASSVIGGEMLAIFAAVLAIILLIWALSRAPADDTTSDELYEPTNTTIEVPVEPIDDEPDTFEIIDDTDTSAEPQPPFGEY